MNGISAKCHFKDAKVSAGWLARMISLISSWDDQGMLAMTKEP
jgi:hypothetical protein